MKCWRIATAFVLLVLLPGIGLIAPVAAQNQFPADAVIRGENIRVRAEPTRNAANNAILQRGDAIILTGAVEVHPDGEFYPVQVPATGVTGWILSLFIDPASIVPAVGAPAVVEPTVAPVAEPNVDVVVEPPEVVVDVPPGEPETSDAQDGRRNRDRANRQEEPAADVAPERVVVTGEGALVSDPFTLAAGQYRVSAAMTVETATGFTAVLNGPNQFSQALFNETIDTPQDWTAEADLTIAETGEYTVDVTNANAAWRIRFIPA